VSVSGISKKLLHKVKPRLAPFSFVDELPILSKLDLDLGLVESSSNGKEMSYDAWTANRLCYGMLNHDSAYFH
jgi:hypothetical protein